MGGTPHRIEGWSAREEVLAADLVRGELLASKAIQDNIRDLASDTSGAAINFFSKVPTWGPVAATFNVNLGAGRGNVSSSTGVTADDSDYQVVEWPNPTQIVFTTPNGANPRIDLVVVTPGTVSQDLSARNVLVDPTARTQVIANLAKTLQPLANLSVIAGTPGATPSPPSPGAGQFALYEVWIPAAAADSTTFVPIQRMFRRAPFPWSTMSGIVTGCHLQWDLTADVSTTSSALTFTGINRVVIDGEEIDFSNVLPIPVVQDSGNNPFGVAAGASDKPYYIYLCGGRHAPQGSFVSPFFSPVCVVESLSPPVLDSNSRPNASLTGPRGTIPPEAAVYIGLGFVVATTTRRRPCLMTDDMTIIVGSDLGGILSLTKTGTGVEALGTPASKPSLAGGKMLARFSLGAASASGEVHFHQDRGDGAAAAPTSIGAGSLNVVPEIRTQVAAKVMAAFGLFYFNPANAKIWIAGVNITTGDVITLTPMGYDHRVARIASRG